jgi:hypothetical protein
MTISRHLDMPTVLAELGVEVADIRGDEVWAWCPNDDHDEKRPIHWSINSTSGDHLCFSCGYSGSFDMLVAEKLDFVRSMKMPDGSRPLDLGRAREWILERGMSLEALQRLPAWEREEALFVPPMGESLLAVYEPPPWEQLEQRQLDEESCAAYGVLWDPKENAWILPVRDPETAELWGWQVKGPGVFKNYPTGIKKSRTLFGLNAFTGSRALIVESPLDAVRFKAAGIEGGLATFGANISDTQMRIVLERADEVIVATDNFLTDPAGRKAALALLKRYSTRIDMRFLDYTHTEAKDPGDMTDDELHDAVDHAKHSWRGVRALGAAS